MSEVIIWNRSSKLKDLDPNVWFEAYPESRDKTLVLIDDSEVVFLEDLIAKGYSGDSDESIVRSFLNTRSEESKKYVENSNNTLGSVPLEEIQKLKDENATLKARVDTLSSTVEELILNGLNEEPNLESNTPTSEESE